MFGRFLMGVTALAIPAYAAGLVYYSSAFPAPGQTAADKSVVLFVAATLGVTLLYVGTCVLAIRRPPRLTTVLLFGAAARLILLFGAPGPILEGDHERLRFDARLVNQRVHPYEFKATHLMDEAADDTLLTGPQLERLTYARAAMTASEDAPRPSQLTRPDLRTGAAPLSLWIGSVADRFKPTSTRGFAFFVLVADAVAVLLLILALRALGRPVAWALVYAWSPIALKESYCTMGPDAFLMPALAGLVYCIATRRRLALAVPLALCAGIRPVLVLLWPLLARRTGLMGLALTGMLFVMPFLAFHADDVPYARYAETNVHVWRHYEYNSALENLARAAFRQFPLESDNTLTIAGVDVLRPGDAMGPLFAKLLCALVGLGVLLYLVIRVKDDETPEERIRSKLRDVFTLLATLLLVSPVLQPAHAIWLLPLIAVRPNGLAWLAFPGLVSLSYLTQLSGPDAADLVFFGGLVSFRIFEHGTLVLLLLIDYGTHNRFFSPPAEPTHLHRRREPADDLAYAPEPLEIGAY